MTDYPDTRFAEMPLGNGVGVIKTLPCGLVAFSKPAGTLSHPNSDKDQDRALLSAPYSYEDEFYEWSDAKGIKRRLWLLNRLDSATSGVILGAIDESLASEVKAQFRNKVVRKTYYALVFGTPAVPSQVWKDRLSVEKQAGQIRTRAAGNIPCESAMRLVSRHRGSRLLSMIKLEPRTGRSHQLRVQCAMHHLPIVGDATYGDFAANRNFAKETGVKRLFLHSFETRCDLQLAGRSVHFQVQAPLPTEFSEYA